MDFKSKNAIVTGAAAGIGLAMATKLLEKGSKVLLTDINFGAVEEAFKILNSKYEGNVKYTPFSCDVTNFNNYKEAFDVCERELGKPNLLINNAGKSDEQSLRNSLLLLFEAPVKGTELAIEYMGKQNGGQGGTVVNIASVLGINAILPVFPYYSASKAALISYTQNIGHPMHFEHTGVNVQCLCPGPVDTALLRKTKSTKFSERVAAYLEPTMDQPTLKPEEVASCLIRLLDEGKPGAVMCVVSGEDPFYH